MTMACKITSTPHPPSPLPQRGGVLQLTTDAIGQSHGQRHTLFSRLSLLCLAPRHPATEPVLEALTREMSDKNRRAFLHACLADAKECTHRPHTRSSSTRPGPGGGGSTEEDGGGGSGKGMGAKEAFLYRMEAQERAK
ncbi:unnamed protein product [Sphacelaria rigidula]